MNSAQAITAGAVTGLSGAAILGAPLEALALGLTGAVLATVWLTVIDNRRKAIASIALSTMLAGWGAPIASAFIAERMHIVHDGAALHMLVALLIGAAAPLGVPLFVTFATRFVEGKHHGS